MKKLPLIIIIAVLSLGGVWFGTNLANNPGEKKDVKVLQAQTQREATTAPSESETVSSAIPVNIRIPKIGVDGSIEEVGLDSKRAMDVPQDADNAGWYKYGAHPGTKGNAVLAGHLDKQSGAPAIFFKLTELKNGDSIFITDASGDEYEYKITRQEKYPYDDFPIGEVFGQTDKSMLNLITCQGNWDDSAKNYSHRTVIYSEMVQ